jgi:ABC-type amino acid transport substrate-binding protein
MQHSKGFRMQAGFALVLLTTTTGVAADLADIKQRGALRVLGVVDAKEPEFFSLKSQATPGFDVEILLGFAKAQKVELKVLPAAAWAALIPALVEGKGDLIAGRFSATPQRRRVIEFTQEVFPTRTVVVTRKPHAGVRTLEELKAERVGTIAGTGMYEALVAAGIPPGRIDTSLASGELSDALRSGKVGAAAWWLEGALQAQHRDPDLALGLVLGPPESLAYGLRKEDQALLAALNEHLQVVRASGILNRLTMKYFGDAAPAILKKARED